MIRLLAILDATILVGLALAHLRWAFGDRPGAVIPTRSDGSPLFIPGPASTTAVALLLLFAAFLLLERGGAGLGILPGRWRLAGSLGVATVLLLRGIGDFRYVGLFKRERKTAFGQRDTRVYTPLVLTLAAMSGVVAAGGI